VYKVIIKSIMDIHIVSTIIDDVLHLQEMRRTRGRMMQVLDQLKQVKRTEVRYRNGALDVVWSYRGPHHILAFWDMDFEGSAWRDMDSWWLIFGNDN